MPYYSGGLFLPADSRDAFISTGQIILQRERIIVSINRRKNEWKVRGFIRSLRGSSQHPPGWDLIGGFPNRFRRSWMPAKCASIRAARQAAAVEVAVGLAPFIHMVSCCFRLVMIAPGAWLKTCLSSWCYSGPEEAASLLRQLTVEGTEAVWKWVEEEAVACKVIMSHLTDFVKEFFTLTFLCKSASAAT